MAISSHQLGATKPDTEAFLRALDRCGVEPSAVCFFDDAMINVDAARRLGMRAFHVEGVEELAHVLIEEAWLPTIASGPN